MPHPRIMVHHTSLTDSVVTKVSSIFYLPQAAAAWLVAIWLIEWTRLRELLVYGLFASFLCAIQDQLGLMYHLWEYRDIGPINTHTEISILIGLSAAPLFGMYFVQGLKVGAPVPWFRMVVITGVALVPETIGLYTGHIVHGGWWNYGASVLAYVLIWLGFWGLHRWFNRVRSDWNGGSGVCEHTGKPLP